MRWTIVGLFIVGIIAAGAAAMLAVAIQAKGGVRAVTDPGQEEIEILIASKDLGANTIVDAESVARKKCKRMEAPEKALSNETQVIGQMLIADVLRGQAFTAKQFPDAESDLKVIQTLKPGNRAMSILLSSEQGIENILYPGCVVDVVATFRLPPPDGMGFGEIVSATILHQVTVLGVGPRTLVSEKSEKDGTTTTDSKRGRMITVQVDPKQAQMLQLAVTQGTVTVTMRNPLDKSEDKIDEGTRLSELSTDLDKRIREMYENSQKKSQPPTLPVATETTGGSSSQPTLVVESRNADADEEEMWVVEVLRGGKIADNRKFPMSQAKPSKK